MFAIIQARAITNAVPAALRYDLTLSQFDHWGRVGQYQSLQPIIRPERKKTEPRSPREMTITERFLWKVNPGDHEWRKQFISDMPDYLSGYFGRKYTKLFESKDRRAANTFLRETIGGKIRPRLDKVNERYQLTDTETTAIFKKDFQRLPNYDREQVLNLATKIADHLHREFNDFLSSETFKLSADTETDSTTLLAYYYLASITKSLQVNPPYYSAYEQSELDNEKALSAMARMTTPDWWYNKLKRRRDMQREHLAIAVGQVQNKASPYASRSCIGEWKEQKEKNWQFIKSKAVEDEATGEQLPFADMVLKSNANPALRRCELMVRMRGFEDIADEYGYVGDFYTITTPSKFHSAYSSGGFVENWQGTDPRDAQKYLCLVWSRARAKLDRQGIKIFGFRVAEPHHDGIPHWHMLLFMPPEHRDKVRAIIRHYALQVDGNEPGAQEHRFKFEEIDKSKGSATGYIAKYISKNIDGYALEGDKDIETGQDLKTMSKAITAWASRWRIRQFQQIGGAPVTVYRELRRLKAAKSEHQVIDNAIMAADVGDWAAYTEKQGGPLVKRCDLKVRLTYGEQENQYCEQVKKIQGVHCPHITNSEIKTRTTVWRIVPKKKEDLLNDSRAAAPWSSVNNCTQSQTEKFSKDHERLYQILKNRGLSPSNEGIKQLLRGSTVSFDDVVVKITNGQLIDVRPDPMCYIYF